MVVDYSNKPVGTMQEMPDGSGHFTEVNPFPVVSLTEESMVEKANHLHEIAHKQFFISNSCNFKVNDKQFCNVVKSIT